MAQLITNAEKYAEQIARLIVDDHGGDVCELFCKDIDYYGEFDCSTCPLKGKCNKATDIKAWLKEENKQ